MSILVALMEFLDQDDWPYTRMESDTVLRLEVRGQNGEWVCFAQAREAPQQAVIYSLADVRSEPGGMAEMAEFLTRANFDLPLGNFELDYETGRVRFKTSIDVEGDRLSVILAKHLVYSNVMTMDRYLPGIRQVAAGTAALTALAAIER